MRRTPALLGAVALVLLGCRREAGESGLEPLETEVVGERIDAGLTTEYDLQALPTEDNTGVRLPSDFPRDLPLYASSSVINYGPANPDRRFIELSIPAQPGVVERRYTSQLESAGWRPREDGSFERGGRSIWVTYREGTPGTWIRIEYPT